MLQQTRVEAVIPYYERFLKRFPSVEVLGAADEQDVLKYWSGLGYYRRARFLHRAARQIQEKDRGRFPDSAVGWQKLPGVGDYTSAAIASLTLGEAVPVVDGNVKRVVARMEGLELTADSRELHQSARAFGKKLMEELPSLRLRGARANNPAGDLNEALMELGATVCTPRSPQCSACPIHQHCSGYAQGCAEALPLPAAKTKSVDLSLVFVVAGTRHEWLLRQRQEGWNPGLYEPPSFTNFSPNRLQRALPKENLSGCRLGAELGQVRHGITHHRIQARVFRLENWNGQEAQDPRQVPLTGLARKVLALAGYKA